MGLRQNVANWFNEKGRASDGQRSDFLYATASVLNPDWAAPWYNRGLSAKYRGDWKASLRFNLRALSLDPEHEAACWNLGIAATALRDWTNARKAWKKYGIKTIDGEEEVRIPYERGCVRLDPENQGEVVWGQRLDPARIAILNVPLPESNRRFNDIILNDGAPEGPRVSDGREYPVFNELAIWEKSAYSTFEVKLTIPSDEDLERLVDLCHEAQLGIEDWSTVRIVCAECSRGNLTEHECANSRSPELRRFAFAAKERDTLTTLLHQWAEVTSGGSFSGPELVLSAAT